MLKKHILIVLAVLFSSAANAQFGKLLKDLEELGKALEGNNSSTQLSSQSDPNVVIEMMDRYGSGNWGDKSLCSHPSDNYKRYGISYNFYGRSGIKSTLKFTEGGIEKTRVSEYTKVQKIGKDLYKLEGEQFDLPWDKSLVLKKSVVVKLDDSEQKVLELTLGNQHVVKDGFFVNSETPKPAGPTYKCNSKEMIALREQNLKNIEERQQAHIQASIVKPKNDREIDFNNAIKFVFGKEWNLSDYQSCTIRKQAENTYIHLNQIDINKASIKAETSPLLTRELNRIVFAYVIRAPGTGKVQVNNGTSHDDFVAVVGAPANQDDGAGFGVGFLCGTYGRGTCGEGTDLKRIQGALRHIYSNHCKSKKLAY